MSRIPQKINGRAKNQEKHDLNEKRQLTSSNTKINWMLELFDEYIKV